jgi:hypothetical protein
VEGTFIQFNNGAERTNLTAWKYSADPAQQVLVMFSRSVDEVNLMFAQWKIEGDGHACTVANVRYQTYISLPLNPGVSLTQNYLQADTVPYNWYIYDINGGHVCALVHL